MYKLYMSNMHACMHACNNVFILIKHTLQASLSLTCERVPYICLTSNWKAFMIIVTVLIIIIFITIIILIDPIILGVVGVINMPAWRSRVVSSLIS